MNIFVLKSKFLFDHYFHSIPVETFDIHTCMWPWTLFILFHFCVQYGHLYFTFLCITRWCNRVINWTMLLSVSAQLFVPSRWPVCHFVASFEYTSRLNLNWNFNTLANAYLWYALVHIEESKRTLFNTQRKAALAQYARTIIRLWYTLHLYIYLFHPLWLCHCFMP